MAARRFDFDFLRGIALLVVLIDHIEARGGVQVISAWTPISLGFSDGAEAFVFLSGLVLGVVYLPRLEHEGCLAVQRSVLRRSIVIYFTFLFSTWSVILVGGILGRYSSTLMDNLGNIGPPLNLLAWSLPMFFQPYSLEILAFYVVLMPFTAPLLWLSDRMWYLAWGISLGLYLAVRSVDELQLPRFPWGTEWYFNPFAWQFVFFLGLAGPQIYFRIIKPRSLKIVLAVLAVAILLFGLRVRWSIGWPQEFGFVPSNLQDWVLSWRDKTRLHPIRILHFLSVAYVISLLLPAASSKIWRSVWLSPIIKAGQNSLQVYAFGVVVMYLCFPLLDAFRGVPEYVFVVTLDCCLLSLAFAYFVSWVKSKLRSSPQLAIQENV